MFDSADGSLTLWRCVVILHPIGQTLLFQVQYLVLVVPAYLNLSVRHLVGQHPIAVPTHAWQYSARAG